MKLRQWIVVLCLTVAVSIACFVVLHAELDRITDLISERELELRELLQSSPWRTGAFFFTTYVLLLMTPIPVSIPATLIAGWIFGFAIGGVISSFGMTVAASLTFGFSRKYLRDLPALPFQRIITRWKNLPMGDAASLLVFLRLTPGFPFFVINTGFGFTRLRLWHFWVISQLAMLPAILLHVYIGSRMPDISELRQQGLSSLIPLDVLLCLFVAGVMPLLIRGFMSHYRGTVSGTQSRT